MWIMVIEVVHYVLCINFDVKQNGSGMEYCEWLFCGQSASANSGDIVSGCCTIDSAVL